MRPCVSRGPSRGLFSTVGPVANCNCESRYLATVASVATLSCELKACDDELLTNTQFLILWITNTHHADEDCRYLEIDASTEAFSIATRSCELKACDE